MARKKIKIKMKPYKENKNGNIIRRTFDSSVDKAELTWHRDHEDRIVIPLNENDWFVQMDNEIPKKLNVNEEFFIPKNTFHRVIKGSKDLVVEIIETAFEEDEYEVYEVYDVLEEGKKKKKKKKKKDACYYKVKSRYDEWPSAYASGSLVKCRKVGAANWGNSTDESVKFFGDDVESNLEEKWSEKYKRSIDCDKPKGFSQKAHCDGKKKTDENIKENLEVYEAKKTDFSKEKSKGLHGWFERQGGKGKSKGWVDCNTCRKDPETGRKKCKTCGRKEGEKRAKYPACRPTPSACGTIGKGKKWGKKTSNENLNISENISIFDKNYLKMRIQETFNHDSAEPMIQPQVEPKPQVEPNPNKVQPNIAPSRRSKPFLPMPEVKPDPKAIGEIFSDYKPKKGSGQYLVKSVISVDNKKAILVIDFDGEDKTMVFYKDSLLAEPDENDNDYIYKYVTERQDDNKIYSVVLGFVGEDINNLEWDNINPVDVMEDRTDGDDLILKQMRYNQ